MPPFAKATVCWRDSSGQLDMRSLLEAFYDKAGFTSHSLVDTYEKAFLQKINSYVSNLANGSTTSRRSQLPTSSSPITHPSKAGFPTGGS